MTNEDMYQLVLTVLRKESRGNIIKPDRFTYLLRQCHHEYYNQQVEKWDISQVVHDSLRPFLVANEDRTFATGAEAIADCASTYRHMVAAYAADTNNPVDIVTPLEWVERQDDELTQPTVASPIMMIGSTNFDLRPTSITHAYITYLKEADHDPFFDYYIDAKRNIQAMSTTYGTAYTLQTDEVYRDGTDSGDVTSVMRELEWADKDKVNIISMLIEKLGISLSSADIAQWAMAKQVKQDVA